MQVNKISQQSFGSTYSDIMLKTAQLAKKQKQAIMTQKPSLYAQLLLKDNFFKTDAVSDAVKSDYFSYLINNVK